MNVKVLTIDQLLDLYDAADIGSESYKILRNEIKNRMAPEFAMSDHYRGLMQNAADYNAQSGDRWSQLLREGPRPAAEELVVHGSGSDTEEQQLRAEAGGDGDGGPLRGDGASGPPRGELLGEPGSGGSNGN